ncbi:hypothetical protein DFJ73DRAFT_634933 [Zopfochytrium polystomum]|nr:hypothetical protein DFJ73DRAFT_634933 [Zopfochytrium polystomum]
MDDGCCSSCSRHRSLAEPLPASKRRGSTRSAHSSSIRPRQAQCVPSLARLSSASFTLTFALFASVLVAVFGPSPTVAEEYGHMTYYYTETGNAGACGSYLHDTDYLVAMSLGRYSSSYCGRQVCISANGVTVQATIKDACESCGYSDLDASPALFSAITSLSAGLIQISWHFCDESPAQTTSQAPAPTTTSSAAPPPSSTASPSSSSSSTSSSISASANSTITSSASSSKPTTSTSTRPFFSLNGTVSWPTMTTSYYAKSLRTNCMAKYHTTVTSSSSSSSSSQTVTTSTRSGSSAGSSSSTSSTSSSSTTS